MGASGATGARGAEGETFTQTAHLSSLLAGQTVNGVMTTWPPAFLYRFFFFLRGPPRSTSFWSGGVEGGRGVGRGKSQANEEEEKKRTKAKSFIPVLMTRLFLRAGIYGGFFFCFSLIADLTFSTCLHRYRCQQRPRYPDFYPKKAGDLGCAASISIASKWLQGVVKSRI